MVWEVELRAVDVWTSRCGLNCGFSWGWSGNRFWCFTFSGRGLAAWKQSRECALETTVPNMEGSAHELPSIRSSRECSTCQRSFRRGWEWRFWNMGATANRTAVRGRLHHWCVETWHSARESHPHRSCFSIFCTWALLVVESSSKRC